ncbi:hypothetical protein [Labrenzia sp. 011]|uniref:hypothetical protein n=1 Tax=Labrenzia sp. 011 TaxID=2171494 RepID=UPI000D51F308|nr:hypothetical protein [Labrenzia sp. 011]PVB63610.1 hypothetical protein DCO57_02125 [Labrenzia sp. 011]
MHLEVINMARFPFYKSNIKDLGKLIAKAALDEDFRRSFTENPSALLEEIGLPPQSTKLLTFKVVDQGEVPNAVALPYRLSTEKLKTGNETYLRDLSRTFSLN